MTRVIFAGTPEFAVPSLDALASHSRINPVAVYTQPDRRAGRGREMQFSAVKARAVELGIPVVQPESLSGKSEQDQLAELKPDLMVVTAYGMLLPQVVLDTPTLGCINVHASLLPRWRGAAPIQRAIQAGDSRTGVALMQMEAGLDTGPVLAMLETPINDSDTGGILHDRLSELGGKLLTANLDALLDGKLEGRVQDDDEATYARKLSKSECPLDWAESAVNLWRTVRAFNPWPLATATHSETQLRIHQCSVVDQPADMAGQVMAVDSTGIVVGTGTGCLRIEVLQKPGGRPLHAGEFLNGYEITVGTVLS